jgi:hypothetical protein
MEEDIIHHDELGVENLYFGLINYFATAKISDASVLIFNNKGDSAGSVKLTVKKIKINRSNFPPDLSQRHILK